MEYNKCSVGISGILCHTNASTVNSDSVTVLPHDTSDSELINYEDPRTFVKINVLSLG